MQKIEHKIGNKIKKNLLKGKEIRKEIENLYNEYYDDKMSDKEAIKLENKIAKLETKFQDLYSSNLVVVLLDEVFYDREDNYQYDVRHIFINEELYNSFKKYDKELLKMEKVDYKEEWYDKEIGMFYLFSGFTVKKEVPTEEIWYDEDKIKKFIKKDENQ